MIDLYCERTSPAFWGEPVNAVTNLAYLAAAWALWLLARRRGAVNRDAWLLIGLAVAVGLGSGAFHTLATRWAQRVDQMSILLFELSFLWLYCRRLLHVPRAGAFGLVFAFLAVALLARQAPEFLNRSLMYAPALAATFGLGIYHNRTDRDGPWLLLGAAGLFTAAVAFRIIDAEVCATFPLGTHFLWHILTAGALYLSGRALLLNVPAAPPRAAAK